MCAWAVLAGGSCDELPPRALALPPPQLSSMHSSRALPWLLSAPPVPCLFAPPRRKSLAPPVSVWPNFSFSRNLIERKPLKLARVIKTNMTLVAPGGPAYKTTRLHLEIEDLWLTYILPNVFFRLAVVLWLTYILPNVFFRLAVVLYSHCGDATRPTKQTALDLFRRSAIWCCN